MNIAFVFPGQGSQSIGMLRELAAGHPEIEQTFAEASQALGMDMWQLAQQGPEVTMGMTENTQPLMLTAGYAVWRAWQANEGAPATVMAGHSLGEYTALTCAGVMSFADAVSLVRDRGRFMQQAVPPGTGAMAAIIGLEDDQVRQACEEAKQNEVVEPVNFNAPGQVAIAGHRGAVERAVEAAKGLGARRAVPLALSVPAHSSLMQPAGERLQKRLYEISMNAPQVPVIHNFNVEIYSDPEEIKKVLIQQIAAPVRWVESIQKMEQSGTTHFIECGPNAVLSGTIKRIAKHASLNVSIEKPDKFDAALSACAP